MSRQKSTVNRIISEAIGHLIQKKGASGFTCEDVELHVRTELGDQLNDALVELGNKKLRDSIGAQARALVRSDVRGLATLHPSLFDDGLSVLYSVRHPGEKTVFKQFTHLNREELSQVIGDLIAQRKGVNRHVRALRRAERRLKRVWDKQPDLTIDEAQAHLDGRVAA